MKTGRKSFSWEEDSGLRRRQETTLTRAGYRKCSASKIQALSRQFQEMISNIPMEHMQISADIISYAKNECGMELNQSI